MMTSTNTSFYKKVLVLLFLSSMGIFCSADPTDGFKQLPLKDHLRLQKPYDKAPEDRYSKLDQVETFWVYTNDKTFEKNSPTRPRAEMRIWGYDYTSDVWQFEGNFYVPQGTTGVNIMQVFGKGHTAKTTLQLRIIDGNLMYYNENVVVPNVYDKWVRVNVIHNVGAQKVTIFINGVQKLMMDSGHGQDPHYFKYGAYAAEVGSSNSMESRWKGIKVLKK